MKKKLSKLTRNEKGQGLIIVLCLLAVGGLVIAPLLSHMYTGLSASQIYEERTALSYAADAGMEDALWKTDNEDMQLEPYNLDPYDYETEYNYSLPEKINGKVVNISIKQIWPLAGLESDANGTTPADGLSITGGVVNAEGKYEVRISNDYPEELLEIDQVAVWLPPGFEYVADSSSVITADNPTEVDWNGGTALRWALPDVNFLDLPTLASEDPLEGGFQPAVQHPTIRTLRFYVTPAGEVASGSYSWVRTTSGARYLSWESSLTICKINATATDNPTGKSATAEAYSYVSKGVDTGWIYTGGMLFTGDYRAIGNTLMQDLNHDKRRETVLSESSASISDIPQDAEVAFAYLYWSAWRDYSGSMDADTTCIFKMTPETETIRPNAIGTYTGCAPFGDLDNYLCVDEEVADGDSTHVRTWYGGTEMDTYSLENPTPGGPINSVTIHIMTMATTSGHDAEVVIRVNETNFFGGYTSSVPPSYTDISATWYNNPYSGNVWNWGELNALEAGVRHHDLNGGYLLTTQVWVEVDHGPPPPIEEMDTYNLEDHSVGSGTIHNVTVHVTSRGTSLADTHAAETVIRTHDTDYFGTYTFVLTSYTDLSTVYTTNPFTGIAWTWAEIDALEAGMRHTDLGDGCVRSTQVYVEIQYGPFLEEEITADTWWLVENQAPDYAYSCFRDVTNLLAPVAPNGNGTYTVGGVDGDTGTELSFAGWSLIIIYSSPYEQGHQFFLWDQLMFAGTNAEGSFTIEGFTAPADAEATLTCFVGEGDYWYDGDSLQFNGYYMSDAVNPQDDVWNSKSSALGGELIEGVDIDTFDVSSPIVNPGDTSADLDFATAQDNWNLIYLILAFRSDLAVLTPSSAGIFCYGLGGS